jgi:ribA/ribD-fused uncharacterized protein
MLLYHKIVEVFNHMFVFNSCGPKVALSKLHRVGPYVKGQNRSVVVEFVRHSDVELILNNRMQLPKDIFVREDYPPEVESRRRVLRPILTKAKKRDTYKGKCRHRQDKLILKGKTYTVEPINNLDELPSDLCPRSAAEKGNDNVVVFFSQGSPFSNFHFAPFTKHNVKYTSNEQFIQASKAQLFEDDYTHAKIMQTTNPYDIKKLGKDVKNFVRQRWEQEAKAIATEGCLAKFSQNGHLLEALIKTDQKTIGEASKDSFWGVGKTLSDDTILNTDSWTGQNLLGKILMTVRQQLQ